MFSDPPPGAFPFEAETSSMDEPEPAPAAAIPILSPAQLGAFPELSVVPLLIDRILPYITQQLLLEVLKIRMNRMMT